MEVEIDWLMKGCCLHWMSFHFHSNYGINSYRFWPQPLHSNQFHHFHSFYSFNFFYLLILEWNSLIVFMKREWNEIKSMDGMEVWAGQSIKFNLFFSFNPQQTKLFWFSWLDWWRKDELIVAGRPTIAAQLPCCSISFHSCRICFLSLIQFFH